jgi:hypothetical protein
VTIIDPVRREMAAWAAYRDYVVGKCKTPGKTIEFQGDATSARLFGEWRAARKKRDGLVAKAVRR